MKKTTLRKAAHVALLALPIAMLPGCAMLDWVKEKLGMSHPQSSMSEMSDMSGMAEMSGEQFDMSGEKKTANGVAANDGSKVLVTMSGKAVITEKMLQDELDQMIAQRPELAQLPKEQLLTPMILQVVVDEWANRKGLYSDPGFKKARAFMIKQLERGLAAEEFSKAHPAKVTDADLRALYDKHKGMLQGKEFEEVKEMLKPLAEQEKQAKNFQDLIEKYKAEYGIEVDADAMNAAEKGMQEMMSGQEMEEEVSMPQSA